MITTGSGLERFFMCRASNVLHRSFAEGGDRYSSYGIEGHAYLQRVGGGMSREAALEEVDEAFRGGIAEIDLEDIRDVLGLTPELSLAYRPATDTARVLGAGLGRQYEAAGVTEDEIPLTVDVAGIDNQDAPTVGFVGDWKMGWSRLTPAERNWQMRGGALALARAFHLELVRVQLIHLREHRPARRDRAEFTAADLAMFAAEARVRHALAVADREAYRRTREEPDATTGSWCTYCPSWHACSAQQQLVRTVVDADAWAELDDEAFATAYRRIREAKSALARVDKVIHAAAARRPILIETLADGTEMWLGTTRVVGDRRFDPEITRTVAREMLDDKAPEEISKHEVTLGRLEAAVKKRVPYGQGASKVRAVLAEVDKRGGIHRPTKHDVALYKLARSLPAKAG